MSSIYQSVMGSDFNRLHPKIQERFGFSSRDRVACIGRGLMDDVWHGQPTLPFLYIGSWRSIMFQNKQFAALRGAESWGENGLETKSVTSGLGST